MNRVDFVVNMYGLVGELSKNIPNDFMAINELLKNSYDAQANTVIIELNSNEKFLRICDDGIGMNEEDLRDSMLIANSNKKYGEFINGRYIQGEKGLGRLSMFRFGNKVIIESLKKDCEAIKVIYDLGLNEDGKFGGNVVRCTKKNIGTDVLMYIDDEEKLKELENFLGNEIHRSKILNSFLADNFKINLIVNGEAYSTNNRGIPLDSIAIEDQVLYVKHNFKDGYVDFYRNGGLILSIEFDANKNRKDMKLELGLLSDLDLQMELSIFKFQSGKKDSKDGKNKVDKLYFNPNTNEICPLIYVNDNLFINYDLFDTEIMSKIKNDLKLNQMIGSVRIYSSNRNIRFNVDRSSFSSSLYTDILEEYLKRINKFIQKIGSNLIKYLDKGGNILKGGMFDFNKPINNIKNDVPFKEYIGIEQIDNRFVYSYLGVKQETTIGDMPKDKYSNIIIKDEIVQTPHVDFQNSMCKDDSLNIDTENSNLDIPLRGKTKSNKIKRTSVTTINNKKIEKIISFNGVKKYYELDINDFIKDVIDQINSLRFDKYKAIIVCVLRSLVQIAVDELLTYDKKGYFKNQNFKSVIDEVSKLFSNELSDNEIKNKVNKVKNQLSKIFQNDLPDLIKKDKERYSRKMLDVLNSWAHRSSHTMFVREDIENTGELVAEFLVIINELIKEWKK